jgi:hypothetical protein
MQLRRFATLATVGTLLVLAACESSSDWSGSSVASAGRDGDQGPCAQVSSCLACTPIVGCGWCQFPDGTGRCVDDPDQCSEQKVFSWTWDPDGCRVPLEAGAITVGTSGPDASVDAGAVDAAVDAPPSD